ncbi:MAG TPA: O-antigen ligase family protein [Thermoanaerobaculia bacterium]|nr:O-antigen ligase family protein [Thermoanaerobaculia bacterium]
MTGLLPALLVLLFAFGCGGFVSGSGAWAAITGQAILLLAAVAGGAWALDPWRLGRRWRLLPWATVAAAGVSWALSPVPRAGMVAILLLPAFVLLPAAVARALGGDRLERGAAVLTAAAAAVALVALADPGLLSGGRALRPFGHHQLAAAWLVTFFPLALPSLSRRGSERLFGLLAALAIGGGVVATRSLLGLVALALQGLAGYRGARRAWRLVLGVALLAAAFAVPRVERVIRGDDPSAWARLDYAAAAGRGIAAHPLAGQGPGATPWTLARFLAPGPGRRPPGELVGDVHSLPLALAYELGLPGALLAFGSLGAFAAVRRRERPRSRAPRLLDAALLGLGGLAFVLLGNAALTVLALPVAAAVLGGVALAAGRPAGEEIAGWRPGGWIAAGWMLVAAALLLPLARAHLAYDRAREAPEPPVAIRELGRAVQADPGFPLYRARRAWLLGPEGAEAARTAAEQAVDVAPLWLAAGVLGRDAELPWAAAALTRACELDPLGAMAPFHLALLAPGAPRAPALAARAIAAEPRLLAARVWEQEPELLVAALAALERDERLDRGWRAELVAKVVERPAGRRREAEIGLVWDGSNGAPGSRYLFRRQPWYAELGVTPVWPDLVASFSIPSAARLATTAPAFFAPAGCAP